MTINLSSIVVYGDSNEKDKDRIALIQNFIESNGGYFERAALKECSTRKEGLDYLIEGEFNGKPINLRIEYKTFEDFSGTWQELEDRLPRAILACPEGHVALIIEYPPIDLTEMESTNCRFINPAVPEGKGNVLGLATFQAKIEEWTNQGIHIRLIQNTTQLTTTILNLLYYCTKEVHGGLWLESKDYKTQFINWLSYMPVKGIGFSVANKLVERFPNMHWIASYSEEDLQECVGKATGTKIYNFLRNDTLRDSIEKGLLDKERPVIIPNLNDVMSKPIQTAELKPTEQNKPTIVQKPIEQIKEPIINPDDSKKNEELFGHTNPDWTPNQIIPKTLEEKIIDEVIRQPQSDRYILNFIMIYEKLPMPEAHKLMKSTITKSHVLRMNQGMVSYQGVKADVELDIGV